MQERVINLDEHAMTTIQNHLTTKEIQKKGKHDLKRVENYNL